jgi:zinc protease
VHAGTGDKGSLTLDWNAPAVDSTTDTVYADVLSSVLNIRLTDHLREQLGASYTPSASVQVLTEPDHLVESYLNVTGDPTNIAKISSIVIDDIGSLRTAGPTSTEFASAMAELTQSYQYFDNQTISDLLVRAPKQPELITQFNDQASLLDSITPASLQKFITQVMPLDQYIEVRTLPA